MTREPVGGYRPTEEVPHPVERCLELVKSLPGDAAGLIEFNSDQSITIGPVLCPAAVLEAALVDATTTQDVLNFALCHPYFEPVTILPGNPGWLIKEPEPGKTDQHGQEYRAHHPYP